MTLLSVVMPTKNRPNTAIQAVFNVLSLPSRDIELIVQDCSDSDDLGQQLAQKFQDSRLKYDHSGRPCSMSDNWNLAMQRVCGEYVLFIGDDDGVVPEIVPVVQWMKRNEQSALRYSPPTYHWPDFPHRRLANRFASRGYTGEAVRVSVQRSMRDSVCAGSLLISGLPHLYHGIVRRKELDRLRETNGVYFAGLNPDFYIAFALASEVDDFLCVDFPLSFSGFSLSSNSGRTTIGTPDSLEKHQMEYHSIVWPEEVPSHEPRFRRITEVTVAESVSLALRGTRWEQPARPMIAAWSHAAAMVQDPASTGDLFARYLDITRDLHVSTQTAIQMLRRQLGLHIKIQLGRQAMKRWPLKFARARGIRLVEVSDYHSVAPMLHRIAQDPGVRRALQHQFGATGFVELDRVLSL